MITPHLRGRTAWHLVPFIACGCLLFFASNQSVRAQSAISSEQEVVVSGEEVPSAYGAPPGFSRSRFSNLTNAYVLPPWAFFFGEIFEGQGFRHEPPDDLFTQEIEKENTGDRGREWGFSQSVMTPILLSNERLKVGVEMEYKNFTVKDTRGDPMNSFAIGPTIAWKPTPQTRLDISPLFGCTDDSPVADVFVAFSWLFGTEHAEAEAPVSTRFRYLTKVLRADSDPGKDSEKEMKQVAPPPCPQWYGDNEWNVNLWGTYAFTNTEYNPNLWLVDVVQSTSEGNPVLGTYDHYIGGDHAWGGGGDIKYFFHRYFGLGIEGFALAASKNGFDIFEDPTIPIFTRERINHDHTIGAVLGIFTLRYPIPCTRFAPYAWAGVGAIFGGGERDVLHTQGPPDAFAVHAQTHHFGSETKLLGQFGAGLEVRIARRIGLSRNF